MMSVVLLASTLLALGKDALLSVAMAQDQPAVKAPAFVSAPGGGNWSALVTWHTQDGQPLGGRLPGEDGSSGFGKPVAKQE